MEGAEGQEEDLQFSSKILKQGLAQLSYLIVTLCNKDFGAWDISTDSISLGVTDT